MGADKVGKPPWNKDHYGHLNHLFGKKQSPELIKKRVDARKNKNSFVGHHHPHTEKTKEKIRQARLINNPGAHKPGEKYRGIPPTGEKHWNWKGGIAHYNNRKDIHHTKEYKDWRNAVLVKDNYTCQLCKNSGGKLIGHHIFPWAGYPELRFNIMNGMTLCKACHLLTHKKHNL
jgi:5-methylcytosine-specific restriction endonuclease McrA